MKARFTGVIGNKGLKPRMTWDYRKRKGQMVRVPFIRFSMFCEDLTKAAQLNSSTGRMERPKEIVQVILPEGDRGQKLFPSLTPGRQVTVEGRMTVNPGVGTNAAGQEQLYANVQVYMDDLQFNDSPIDRQVSRIANLLVSAGYFGEDTDKAKKDAEKLVEKANIYLANQVEKFGPPREIEDRTSKMHSPEEEPAPAVDPDPDKPDF